MARPSLACGRTVSYMPTHPETAVLAMIIHDALNGPDADDGDGAGAIVHAAVHAWMEGHVEGEGRAGTHTLGEAPPDEKMPSPPFPGKADPRFREILGESAKRFGRVELVSAVMYAAAVAYARGIEEGAACEGCLTPGIAPAGARLRVGQIGITLRAGSPTVFDRPSIT